MPLDKQQKTTQAAKTCTMLRLALGIPKMAGAAEQTGGGEAVGVMGSSPQHCSCPSAPCPGWHSLDMGRLGCVARLMVASLSGPQPALFLALTM